MSWLRSDVNFVGEDDGGTLIMGMVLDITPRKELMFRLQRTSALYQVAQKHSRLNMWELDLKNRRIIQTEESKALHGYGDVVENVPDSLFESGYFHPETEAVMRDMFERIYRGETPVSAVYKAQRNDSEGFWWEKVTYELVFGENGDAVSAIGISEDVTAQKESELQQNKDALLNQMLREDVLFSMQIDLNAKTVIGSHFSKRMLLPESLKNAGFEEIFQYLHNSMANPDDAKRFSDRFSLPKLQQYIQKRQDIPTSECRQKGADGHIFWACLTLRAIVSPENGHRIITLYARDITGQKKRELELQQKADRDEESGLYNYSTARLMIQNILESSLAADKNGALALLEVDGFSAVGGQAEKKALMWVLAPRSCRGCPPPVLLHGKGKTPFCFSAAVPSPMQRIPSFWNGFLKTSVNWKIFFRRMLIYAYLSALHTRLNGARILIRSIKMP